MNSDLLYKIAITLIPEIGDIVGKKLVSYCGSVEAVFREKKNFLMKIPGVGTHLANCIVNQNVLKRAEKEIKFIEKFKITPLFYLDKNYPQRLKHCADNPIMLYYKGNADLNSQKIISIVGTRNATEYGKELCNTFIRDVSEMDILIVSGLAYGIDANAHKAALDNNLKTVGILAHGLDRIYPHLNKPLAGKMLNNGGLLTEFISNTNPDRENFPKRNRIVAGISDAVIVIESALKGGALITADIANSYNRDVFAFPGKIGDKYSEGTNNFIKTNRAALIQSAKDLKYIMRWEENDNKSNIPKQHKLFVDLSPEEKTLVEILKIEGETGFDKLYLKSKLNMSKVAASLLNLEFEGVVKVLPGKVYKLL